MFGFWAMVLVAVILVSSGRIAAIAYADGRNFTEPLFVFAIMVVAGSRPILQLSALIVNALCRLLPMRHALATDFLASHHPAIVMGMLLFFIGYSAAYPRHHDALILREALLVAFFLAGLVVLGGHQHWWLQQC